MRVDAEDGKRTLSCFQLLNRKRIKSVVRVDAEVERELFMFLHDTKFVMSEAFKIVAAAASISLLLHCLS